MQAEAVIRAEVVAQVEAAVQAEAAACAEAAVQLESALRAEAAADRQQWEKSVEALQAQVLLAFPAFHE